MNRPAPRARRGAHRSRRNVAGAVVPSLLAVVAVVALVTSLYVWRGQEAPDTAVAASTPLTSAPATPSAAAPSTAPPTPTTPPSTTPAPTATATAKPTRSASAAALPVGEMEVVVLNQTRRAGLAKSVAEVLRARGWTVVKTGNFRGQVPATTVYYPPGAEADARAAAEGLPTAPRVKPRFGNLSTTRLTVIVTDSYPT